MKQKHHEKEQYINMLAQDKEEMKVPQRFGLLCLPPKAHRYRLDWTVLSDEVGRAAGFGDETGGREE